MSELTLDAIQRVSDRLDAALSVEEWSSFRRMVREFDEWVLREELTGLLRCAKATSKWDIAFDRYFGKARR